MRRAEIIIALLFSLAALAARAAHTQATLVLSDTTARPGDTVWTGVDLKMDAGWHTYWKNSGEAGIPTTIAWQLPPGVTAGDIQWPLPEKFPPIEVTTYGYENETMLLVPLKIASNAPAGPITLSADLAWLECKDICVPGKATVRATLNIGNETKPSADATEIEAWTAKVPQTNSSLSLHAWWEYATNSDTRPLVIETEPVNDATKNMALASVDFFPDPSSQYDVLPATRVLSAFTADIALRKMVQKFSGDWPNKISGVIVMEYKGGQRTGIEVSLPVADQTPASESASAPPPGQSGVTAQTPGTPAQTSTTRPPASLALMLLYAFIGGLILNVMPCVLPVIALKILGFVSEARSEPRRVRNLGFIYALGVLASFSAMAIIVIGLKSAGHQVGWGMQFGSPVFVVCLTTLVTLVALNLFGVFEITPGGKVMDAAGNLASKHGAPGAFFNGFLATTLATPCTAAYLVTALGFAFAQNAGVIYLIFLFVGSGLAAPYVLLSCNPALLKFLPKPGAWMGKFKIAMGFPMLATAIWLLNVAASDYGSRVLWLGIFLVVLAFAAWLFGDFVQRGRQKGIAVVIVLLLLIGDYTWALEGHLHWREMQAENVASSSMISTSDGIAWRPWTPQAVATARAAGKPVLVDFTATWCVTCNAIVKPALETADVIAKLKQLGAMTLLGDYTRTPQQMTDEIASYGNAGVPLVLVFPKDPSAPAIVVRQPGPLEFPSSYSKAILAALDKADQ